MSYTPDNPYQSTFADSGSAALAEEWERTTFMRRTYSHLAGAIAAFIMIEFTIFTVVPDHQMVQMFGRLAQSPFNWLLILGAFMVVSWVASSWANSAASLPKQYLGLGLFVVAESLIFVPLLFIAKSVDGAILAATLMTTIVFTGLTLMVFTTRADLSWMGRYLFLAGFAAMGFILCSIFIGFSLGILFSAAMVVFASGYILYETSNILHHYRTTQYVAAALALFSSVALLFWYVLRIVIALRE